MRVLLTGAAGFIGSHFTEHLLRTTDWDICILDRLDSTSTLHRLTDMECWSECANRVRFVHHDLRAPINAYVTGVLGDIDYIFHLAASTHVDRSIQDPLTFVYDNVVGTANLLVYARTLPSLKWFLYFSTDEVFGPAPIGVAYAEWDRYNSGNPYAATKAGAEELCLAFHNTYKLPVIVTHCMNVFGERQHWEKYIPLVIRKILLRETLQIHADKACTIPGSRFYIHARNVAAAAMFVLANGMSGDKYNIVGEREVNNLELAKLIEKFIGLPLHYELVSWHESRPGHDLRYALSGRKLLGMGWSLPLSLEASLEKTVRWYLRHSAWLDLPSDVVNAAISGTPQPHDVNSIAENRK